MSGIENDMGRGNHEPQVYADLKFCGDVISTLTKMKVKAILLKHFIVCEKLVLLWNFIWDTWILLV